jgi:DNA-binding transcriptional MerR regulator
MKGLDQDQTRSSGATDRAAHVPTDTPAAEAGSTGTAATDSAPTGPGDTGTADEVEFTVDELAAAAGLPVRTVRHYQSEKVLQPPERRGRIAVYRREHLERLQLVARLQDRGLRLSAIRDALKRVEKGELWLEDWLGLGDQLRAPWSEERPVVLTADELSDRVDHRPGMVTALVEAGLARRRGGAAGTFLVPSPGLLDIALELDAAGIDVGTAAGGATIMRKQVGRATEELVEHFLTRAGEGFARSGSTPDITQALVALRPLAGRAIRLIFAQEVERALRDAVDKGQAAPATSPATDRPDSPI